MNKFYTNYCKKKSNDKELYFFDGFPGRIELDKSNIKFQKVSENLLVRYASPKSNFDRLRYELFTFDKDDILEETLSFDSALGDLEKTSTKYTQDLTQNKEVYFLPTNFERIIKDIIVNNRRRKIPRILEPLIPTDIKTKIKFSFVDFPEDEYITHDKIGEFSTSFMKVEDAKDYNSVKQSMDYIKLNFKEKFLDEIDNYFIGNIKEGFGVLQRDSSRKYEAPSTFHYHFILRNDNEKSMEELLNSLSDNFRAYPFE